MVQLNDILYNLFLSGQPDPNISSGAGSAGEDFWKILSLLLGAASSEGLSPDEFAQKAEEADLKDLLQALKGLKGRLEAEEGLNLSPAKETDQVIGDDSLKEEDLLALAMILGLLNPPNHKSQEPVGETSFLGEAGRAGAFRPEEIKISLSEGPIKKRPEAKDLFPPLRSVKGSAEETSDFQNPGETRQPVEERSGGKSSFFGESGLSPEKASKEAASRILEERPSLSLEKNLAGMIDKKAFSEKLEKKVFPSGSKTSREGGRPEIPFDQFDSETLLRESIPERRPEIKASRAQGAPSPTSFRGERGDALSSIKEGLTSTDHVDLPHPAEPNSSFQGGKEAPMRVSAQDFVQAVEKIILQTPRPAFKKVTLQIHPPDLGRVELEIHYRQGQVETYFRVENHHVREIIQAGLPRLEQNLDSQGIKLAQTQVEVGSYSFSGGGQGPPDQGASGFKDRSQGRASVAASRAVSGEPSNKESRPLRPHGAGVVDVLV